MAQEGGSLGTANSERLPSRSEIALRRVAQGAANSPSEQENLDAGLEAFLHLLDPELSLPRPSVAPETIDLRLARGEERTVRLRVANQGRGYLHGAVECQPAVEGLELLDHRFGFHVKEAGGVELSLRVSTASVPAGTTLRTNLRITTNGEPAQINVPVNVRVVVPVVPLLRDASFCLARWVLGLLLMRVLLVLPLALAKGGLSLAGLYAVLSQQYTWPAPSMDMIAGLLAARTRLAGLLESHPVAFWFGVSWLCGINAIYFVLWQSALLLDWLFGRVITPPLAWSVFGFLTGAVRGFGDACRRQGVRLPRGILQAFAVTALGALIYFNFNLPPGTKAESLWNLWVLEAARYWPEGEAFSDLRFEVTTVTGVMAVVELPGGGTIMQRFPDQRRMDLERVIYTRDGIRCKVSGMVTGYLHKSVIETRDSDKAVVKARDGANLRADPSTQAPAFEVVPKGEYVTVAKTTDANWYAVLGNGYVPANGIRPANPLITVLDKEKAVWFFLLSGIMALVTVVVVLRLGRFLISQVRLAASGRNGARLPQ